MPERTIKLTIEYDGSDFSGWQVQPRKRTVQGEIENALSMILRHPVRITAAGRTDAGVHAKGQVANFKTTSGLETGQIRHALNGCLPRDVAIRDAEEAAEDFNARFDATSRTYRYTLSDRKIAVGRHFAWEVKYSLSRDLLEKATEPLQGLLNLKGLSKGDEDDDYESIIFKKSWTFDDNFMIFEVNAIRFFHNTVRRIIGTAVEVARGAENPDLMMRILDSGDRSLSGPTAPASGLCLVHVDYGDSQ